MLHAVPERAAQQSQAEGLAEDVRVHRDVHDKRVALALLDHFLELVDDYETVSVASSSFFAENLKQAASTCVEFSITIHMARVFV